ncbi:MAG: PAS domain-containing sensor histidine kinase, partial [Nitrospirales bacterium]
MPSLRFGLKGKEALSVTVLTLLVVAATTLVHLSQLTKVVVAEAMNQADLIAKQIYAQSSRSLQRALPSDPQEALRHDLDLRSILDTSVGYSPHLLYAMLTDHQEMPILHSERDKEGIPVPDRPLVKELLTLNPVDLFQVLYREGRIYET